jgi:hypothetical protein
MPLFGKREPCSHCGKNVKQPADPAIFLCPHCGQPGPWASPDQISAWEKTRADREREVRQTQEFADYLRQVVGDDILTPDEEARLQERRRTLGVDLAAFLQANPDLARHALIAEANGGILPQVRSPHLIPKKGEVVHLELQATLLKDVAI